MYSVSVDTSAKFSVRQERQRQIYRYTKTRRESGEELVYQRFRERKKEERMLVYIGVGNVHCHTSLRRQDLHKSLLPGTLLTASLANRQRGL